MTSEPLVCVGCGLLVDEYPEDHPGTDYCTHGEAPACHDRVPQREWEDIFDG